MRRLLGSGDGEAEPSSGIVRAVEDGASDRGPAARFGVRSTRFGVRSARPSAARAVSPHSAKFRLATGFLLGIGVLALVMAVALAARPGSNSTNLAWSAWAPTTGGKLGATEIAQRVAPFYRLSPSAQLDVITLVNLANPDAQGTATGSGLTVAVKTGTSASSLSLLTGTTIAYNLCGTGGVDCQLPGAPSTGRMLLLRREALELALYTFKYIGGTENVVCVLPPGRAQTAGMFSQLAPHMPTAPAASSSQPVTTAVVFRRQELQPWLEQPLSSTLSDYPLTVSEIPIWQKTQEAGLVDQITAEGLFSEQVESLQSEGTLMVLNQLPAQ